MAIKEASQRQITEQQFIQIAELQKENQKFREAFEADAAALKAEHGGLVSQLLQELEAVRGRVPSGEASQLETLQISNAELQAALRRANDRLAEMENQKATRSTSRRTTPLPPASGPPPNSPLPPTPQTPACSTTCSRAPSMLEIPGPLGEGSRRGSEESITTHSLKSTGQPASASRRASEDHLVGAQDDSSRDQRPAIIGDLVSIMNERNMLKQ